jgi:hypothetical protein
MIQEKISTFRSRVIDLFSSRNDQGRRYFSVARSIAVDEELFRRPEEELRKIVIRRLKMLRISFDRYISSTIHELETGHDPYDCECGRPFPE